MTDPPVPVSCLERSVYLPRSETLVLADLHLGRGAESRLEVPLDAASDVADRLERAIQQVDPQTVVFAGDLLHSFSRVPPGVAEAVTALRSTVSDAGAKTVVTPGNHDTMLAAVFDGQTAATHETSGGVVITHGHEEPRVDGDLYVVGHEHPVLRVDGRKHPCFLYGPAPVGGMVLVLPAFTRLAKGASVHRLLADSERSPLLTRADELRPGVRDTEAGETLWFPPLAECRHVL